MLIHTTRGIILPPDLDNVGWRVKAKMKGDDCMLRAVNGSQSTRWMRWYADMVKAARALGTAELAQPSLFEEVSGD